MAKSFKGQFLISAKHLKDENFYKCVVLVIEHGAEGAMGVIVNRPMNVSLDKALSQHFPIPKTDRLLYCGGPVESSALLILHNSNEHDQELGEIAPNVFVGTSADVFDRVVSSLSGDDSEFRFRVFAGYSGWAEDQLETEMKRGDWHTMPASDELIFRDDPYDVWEDALRELNARSAILPSDNDTAQWN